MPALKTYRLFISHAWQYHDDYYRLVEMLNAANNFRWYNYSVPEHDPKTPIPGQLCAEHYATR